MRRALLLAVLVVLSGCSALTVPETTDSATPDDPTEDTIGWEDSFWYNSSVVVDESDGLNETELNVVVTRSMARIERIRGVEFERSVPVEIISREEFRADPPFETNRTHSRWNNQVWEGLLLVGEGENVSNVFQNVYGSAVLGYYEPTEDRIVVVSDSDEPRISRGTLVHELVHALQDQQFGIEETPPTQDEQLARNGVVEGEAIVVKQRYGDRCDGEWSCIESYPSTGGGGVDRGVLLVISYPYAVGPEFVRSVEGEDGWGGVDDLHESHPTSTEQVSNPELYSDESPADVTVPDRSSAEWSRFDHDPVADTVGQASIQVMLWQNGAGNRGYTGPASEGWEGDSLVPYHSGDEYGYVWELAWESPDDAAQFQDAYLDALRSHGAEHRGDGVYVVPESSPFGDAFRVTRDGSRVRIVNGPTVEDLDAIHGR